MKIDGAAVAHLVFDLGRRGGRIDAVDDRAERLRGEIADQPLLADVAHDGDALAARETERRERLARSRDDEQRIVAPGALAIDAEMLGAECDVGSGARRARSHSSAGAVVRRNASRLTAPVPAIMSRVPVCEASLYRLRNRIL